MNYYDVVSAISCGEKIYNLPLRVTYYCRVSTDSDVQLNSLDNQLEYYENYIKNNNQWTFVSGYVEEGVTGTRADKRPSFMKMILDAKLNKFDLIITKDVSRFARDLEDSIHYIRKLKEWGVGVFFENQSLNTFDSNSELTLNILFNIAQEESKKISASVKFGYRKAISQGHVLGSSNITGYRKDNCKLIIVEEEAKMVRKLFELYATGEYGFHKLAKILSDEGYLNKKGRIYDKDSLKRMIENPKYKGFYRAKTYEILDYRTKKRKKNSVDEQVIYKCDDGSVPAIVSEELWDKANYILSMRAQNYKKNNCWSGSVKYPFSSKIYCGEHNINFQRSCGSKKNNRPTWSCGLYLQHGLESCVSPIIKESDLYNIFKNIMATFIINKSSLIESMLRLYENINDICDYDYELNLLDKKIKLFENKKTMVLDLVFSGKLSTESLKVQFEEYEKEIELLKKKKEKVFEQRKILNINQMSFENIAKSIEEEIDGAVVETFVRNFVTQIFVFKVDDDRHKIRMEIYLNIAVEQNDVSNSSKKLGCLTKKYFPYLLNQEYHNAEKSNKNSNCFIYNVYLNCS